MASKSSTLMQTLRSFIKKPWQFTGPCSHPEYREALPKATEYHSHAPATAPARAIVPTSDPETVFDIKYFPRDQRRNRPPIKRTLLRKADVQRMAAEKKTFEVADFPQVYLADTVVEGENTRGGGYQ